MSNAVLDRPAAPALPALKVIVPGLLFHVLSSDREFYYPVNRVDGELTCRCLHEVNGRRNGKACRHIREVRVMEEIEETKPMNDFRDDWFDADREPTGDIAFRVGQKAKRYTFLPGNAPRRKGLTSQTSSRTFQKAA